MTTLLSAYMPTMFQAVGGGMNEIVVQSLIAFVILPAFIALAFIGGVLAYMRRKQ